MEMRGVSSCIGTGRTGAGGRCCVWVINCFAVRRAVRNIRVRHPTFMDHFSIRFVRIGAHNFLGRGSGEGHGSRFGGWHWRGGAEGRGAEGCLVTDSRSHPSCRCDRSGARRSRSTAHVVRSKAGHWRRSGRRHGRHRGRNAIY